MIRVSVVSFSALNIIFVAHTFISFETAFMIFDGTLANCNALIIQSCGTESKAFLQSNHIISKFLRLFLTCSSIILFINSWSAQPQLPFLPRACSSVIISLIEQCSSRKLFIIPVQILYMIFWQAIGLQFLASCVKSFFGNRIVLLVASQSGNYISSS